MNWTGLNCVLREPQPEKAERFREESLEQRSESPGPTAASSIEQLLAAARARLRRLSPEAGRRSGGKRRGDPGRHST